MLKNTKNLVFILILMCFSFAAEGPKSGMVSVHGGTLFWSFITFLLLLVTLKKVAWTPIIEALENRESQIKDALNAADKARHEAEKVSNDYEESIKRAQIESQKIISDAKSAGEKLRIDIEENATIKADQIIENAKKQIDTERAKVMNEIKSIAVEISIQSASKLINKNLDSDDNRKLVNETLDNIGHT